MTSPASSEGGSPVWVDPDLDFIRALNRQGGDSLKKCFQCGTCSATCNLSPDTDPFPRKEMAWALWGMKDRLLADPDVWLCYHCEDCSTVCPRSGGPGDVLAAVRQECVLHYSVPRFLGRWVSQPQAVPLLLGIPAALLALALFLPGLIGLMLGKPESGSLVNVQFGENIVYPYSSAFPHWLLNSFFGFFSLLALLSVAVGARRFWQAMKAGASSNGDIVPAKTLPASIGTVARGIFTHDKFNTCDKARSRFWSHALVFYGFIALSLVSFWVVTAKINPIIQSEFVYPFSLFSPWKMLANIGGLAVLAGCALMIWDRLKEGEEGSGSYSDWALIAALMIVVITGFVSEVLHYIHLEPHRHIAYFVHLMFVFTLLIYLPYSKLAHIVYRTTALVFAEYSGREDASRPATAVVETNVEEEEKDHAGEGSQSRYRTGNPCSDSSGGHPDASCVFRLCPRRCEGAEAPEKPDSKHTKCVKETEYMRFHHWELLRGLREEVVRDGVRGDISLDGCWNCHQSKVRFCDRCHEAATVRPDCFGCHYYPDLDESVLER